MGGAILTILTSSWDDPPSRVRARPPGFSWEICCGHSDSRKLAYNLVAHAFSGGA